MLNKALGAWDKGHETLSLSQDCNYLPLCDSNLEIPCYTPMLKLYIWVEIIGSS